MNVKKKLEEPMLLTAKFGDLLLFFRDSGSIGMKKN